MTQTVDLSTTTESQLVELNSTLGWTNPDTKYNYNLRYYKLDEELHYTSNEPFSFYNSLTADAFGGVESPFDWVQSDNGDDWLLPIKFDYDKSTNVYDSLSADILIGTEVVGGLSFGDYSNNLSDWRYATYYSNGTYELSDVCSATNAKLRVSGFVVNSNLTNFSYTEVVYEEDVNFTTGSTSDLYGIFVLYDDITAGSYDIALLPIYTGTASGASCEIVFEALNENHRTYTCSLSYFTHDVENFTVVSLLNCEEYDTYTNNGEEYSLFEEYIDTDFGGGVKITLVYNMNNGAGEKTIVAYTSHIFIVQH